MHAMGERLIDSADECAAACEVCATACLSEADIDKMAACIRLDRDCADLCRLVAMLATRKSTLTPSLAAVVVEACESCADECERHEMEHCKACAKACRECARQCSRQAAA